MREAIVKLVLDYPKRILALSIFALLIIGPGLLQLKPDFSYRAWYSEDDPLLIQYDEFESMFGNDDSVLISIKGNDLYSKESLSIIYDITEKLWTIPGLSLIHISEPTRRTPSA